MKHLLVLLCLAFKISFSQTIQQCKHRFDRYLNFNSSLNNFVKFEEDAIYLLNKTGSKEFAIYKHELSFISSFFENTSYLFQESFFLEKGIQKFSARKCDSLFINLKDKKNIISNNSLPLKGYRIAIDPGHFGTNLKDAKIEYKYVYFIKDTLNINDSVKIFESELNFNTAFILKKMLEEKGATVFLTRTQKNFTSFNCNYSDWINTNKLRVLDSLKNKNLISDEHYFKFKKSDEHDFFRDFFRDFELLHRSQIINEFKPHLSIIIHFNVDEKNQLWLKPSKNNYTMAFIGGGFVADNFDKIENKINFLRLLCTNQLSKSETISGLTVINFHKNLNIPIANKNSATYLNDKCLTTNLPGVFSRNLLLCRTVNSPLVYGESLYQDNEFEITELMKNDKEIFGIKTNSRVFLVAKSYFDAISAYFKIK